MKIILTKQDGNKVTKDLKELRFYTNLFDYTGLLLLYTNSIDEPEAITKFKEFKIMEDE